MRSTFLYTKALTLKKNRSPFLIFQLFESESYAAPMATWDSKVSNGCTFMNLRACSRSSWVLLHAYYIFRHRHIIDLAY